MLCTLYQYITSSYFKSRIYVTYQCSESACRNVAMVGMRYDAFHKMSKLNKGNGMC